MKESREDVVKLHRTVFRIGRLAIGRADDLAVVHPAASERRAQTVAILKLIKRDVLEPPCLEPIRPVLCRPSLLFPSSSRNGPGASPRKPPVPGSAQRLSIVGLHQRHV